MKYVFYFLFLIFLNSCIDNTKKLDNNKQEYQFQKTTFPNGQTDSVKYLRIKDEYKIVKDIYENGNLFRLAKRYKSEKFIITERWWFQPDGNIMNYKCYQNDQLILYSKYDDKGQLIKVDGSPLLFIDTIQTEFVVEQNVDYVRRIYTVKPPKTKVNIWIDGDIETPAIEEIKRNSKDLYKCEIEGDSTGYILELTDTLIRKFPILWSINDSLSDEILKAGKQIDLFSGKPK